MKKEMRIGTRGMDWVGVSLNTHGNVVCTTREVWEKGRERKEVIERKCDLIGTPTPKESLSWK